MAKETANEANATEATGQAGETTGRALVTLTASAESPSLAHRNPRHDASFVIHLIATAEHAPQTRNLRRAAPNHAAATYNGTATRERMTAAPPRRALSRFA